jgi:RNA polymerase sigma-32 factor
MNKLNSRERRVLEARVLADQPMTLEELAAEFGVARVRVRQLEARVLEKIGLVGLPDARSARALIAARGMAGVGRG